MSSKNKWNETRPSSAAVPEKTLLRAIRELTKDKIASGGNMNKTAEDKKQVAIVGKI